MPRVPPSLSHPVTSPSPPPPTLTPPPTLASNNPHPFQGLGSSFAIDGHTVCPSPWFDLSCQDPLPSLRLCGSTPPVCGPAPVTPAAELAPPASDASSGGGSSGGDGTSGCSGVSVGVLGGGGGGGGDGGGGGGGGSGVGGIAALAAASVRCDLSLATAFNGGSCLRVTRVGVGSPTGAVDPAVLSPQLVVVPLFHADPDVDLLGGTQGVGARTRCPLPSHSPQYPTDTIDAQLLLSLAPAYPVSQPATSLPSPCSIVHPTTQPLTPRSP